MLIRQIALIWILVAAHWATPVRATTEPAAGLTPAAAARRVALIIGNGDYTDITRLKNPPNDASDMCNALRELGYQTFCYTNITTRVQFRSVIQDFTEQLSSNTVSVVYYAGHAVQINGENYLIPTAARLRSTGAGADQSLRLGYVMKQLQAAHSMLKILVIDACRDELPAAGAASSGQIDITAFPDESFVLYSTAANGEAMDGQGRNGLLTKSLLGHLKDTGDLNDLFNHVADDVRADTSALGFHQTPEIRRNSTLRYCFVKCTELEDLQAKEELAAKEIARLQASVAAGDGGSQAMLTAQLKYQAELKRKDEQLAKKAREREEKSLVPPSF